MTIQQHHAQLIVGSLMHLHAHVDAILQNIFCKRAQEANKSLGCFCDECKKIKHRQHHAVVWMSPEKSYTVDDIQIIFDRVRFALDQGQQFFFILDNAQTLTTTTANRILKILEEPPQGYCFILLTTNIQAIMPTILSRCVVTDLTTLHAAQVTYEDHPLLAFFSGSQSDPSSFEQELKKQALNEIESLELLQILIGSYTKKLHTADQKQQEYFWFVLAFLLAKMRKPPQQGSSDLFWKNLFLSFPRNNR